MLAIAADAVGVRRFVRRAVGEGARASRLDTAYYSPDVEDGEDTGAICAVRAKLVNRAPSGCQTRQLVTRVVDGRRDAQVRGTLLPNVAAWLRRRALRRHPFRCVQIIGAGAFRRSVRRLGPGSASAASFHSGSPCVSVCKRADFARTRCSGASSFPVERSDRLSTWSSFPELLGGQGELPFDLPRNFRKWFFPEGFLEFLSQNQDWKLLTDRLNRLILLLTASLRLNLKNLGQNRLISTRVADFKHYLVLRLKKYSQTWSVLFLTKTGSTYDDTIL